MQGTRLIYQIKENSHNFSLQATKLTTVFFLHIDLIAKFRFVFARVYKLNSNLEKEVP